MTSFPQARIGKAILVWNIVALVVIAVVWGYAAWIMPMSAPLRVTTLDRAGVLDEAKLREVYPRLAENMRHELGLWIAEKERRTASFSAGMGTVIAAVNLVLILIVRRKPLTRRRKSAIVVLAAVLLLATGGFVWYWHAPAAVRQVNALPDDARAIEPLIAALKDEEPGVRLNAAAALGRLGDPRGVEFLIVALKDRMVHVRGEAAWALGELGDPQGIEPLEELLGDENEAVRDTAKAALAKLRGKASTP